MACEKDVDEAEINSNESEMYSQKWGSRPEEHPLINHLVVRNLLSWKWNAKELMQLRQVCRLWNAAAFPYLSPIFDEAEIVFTESDAGETARIDEFLEMLKTNPQLQFHKFSFSDLGSPFIIELLERTGENITTLKLFCDALDPDRLSIPKPKLSEYKWHYLEGSDESSSEDENDDSFDYSSVNSWLFYGILFERCPKLKYLSLGDLPEDVKNFRIFGSREKKETGLTHITIRQNYGTSYFSLPFLCDLLEACPCIFEVKLETDYDIRHQDELLLRALVETGRLNNLHSLQLKSFQTVAMKYFVTLDWDMYSNLKKLTLSSFHSVSDISFGILMEMISHTIIELKLKRMTSFHFRKFQTNFPAMQNLEKLTIGIPHLASEPSPNEDLEIPTFGTIQYTTQFPKLLTLKIKEDSKNLILNEWFSHQNPHLVLKELHLPLSIKDHDVIAQAATIFPNVEKFKYGSSIKLSIPHVVDL